MSYELVSEADNFETRTASNGTSIEVREFREVQLMKFITSYERPDEAFTTKGVLTYLYNGELQIKSLSNPKKFVCTSDVIQREEIPGAGAKRMQVWVYYSPWAVTTLFNGT